MIRFGGKDCEHFKTNIELMPEEHVHYAKLVCADCNKFIKWHPNPLIKETTLRRNVQIERIINNEDGYYLLSDYERKFMNSIHNKAFLTEKQSAFFQKILDKYAD